jgi:alkylhydroperoxidase family enzyme
VYADLETAPISEPLRATLRFLRAVTLDRAGITSADVRGLFAAGATREQIEDALAVCWAFNTINRIADTFEFDVPGPSAFAASTKMLLSRGYK